MIQQETSYVAGYNDFCIYNAENANLIKEHAKKIWRSNDWNYRNYDCYYAQYISSELINFYEKVFINFSIFTS